MKINETFQYEGTDVESVYGLVTDESFRAESSEAQHALDQEVSVESDGEGHIVTITRTMPAEMPDFIKKLTGDTVKVHQVERWSGPAADGSRTADVSVDIVGQPASMKGTSTIANTAGGASMSLDGKVEVKIPLIGRKIEPEVAKAIITSLRKEVELGTQKLS